LKKTITKKTKKKMPPKNLKVTDVVKPGRTAPSATARPLIVTNRPVIQNDPMIVDTAKQADMEPTAPLVNRTAKTIRPVASGRGGASADTSEKPTDIVLGVYNGVLDALPTPEPLQAPGTDTPAPESQQAVTPVSVDEPAIPPKTGAAAEPAAGVPKLSMPDDEDGGSVQKDITEQSEEAVSAAEAEAEAAEAARQQALEKLAESGTYAVPIDALQRKRSRMFVAVMCTLAIILALALVDLVLDANLIKVPDAIPHTHLFSGN
jgi:hypothetical protein